MSRYRKVDPRIWNDQKFREMSDAGKLVFFMLLTHPNMTAIGAMRATLAGLAEEMGWEPEAFREAFREAFDKGMAEHDQKACLIALPNFLKYNPPESPNVVKAWVNALDLLPECDLKTRVIARAKDFTEGLTEAFREAYRKTMPNQEQEQEQEQEQTTGGVVGAEAPKIATAVELAVAMRKAGIEANAAHPVIIELAAQGLTVETALAACTEAKESKPGEKIGAGYVVAILTRWKREAAAIDVRGVKPPKANKQEALEARNQAVAANWTPKTGGDNAAA